MMKIPSHPTVDTSNSRPRLLLKIIWNVCLFKASYVTVNRHLTNQIWHIWVPCLRTCCTLNVCVIYRAKASKSSKTWQFSACSLAESAWFLPRKSENRPIKRCLLRYCRRWLAMGPSVCTIRRLSNITFCLTNWCWCGDAVLFIYCASLFYAILSLQLISFILFDCYFVNFICPVITSGWAMECNRLFPGIQHLTLQFLDIT